MGRPIERLRSRISPLQTRATNETPQWFATAVDHAPEHLDIDADGCRVHLRVWGDAGNPPLVLVHGGGAHSGWWDHIAPFFAASHRVIAPDLSGHGDSDTRPFYELRTWAKEVVMAPAAVGATGRPTVVGHSVGGWVSATAAAYYGTDINSVLIIDSPLRERAPESGPLRNRGAEHGYPTRDDIVARFRPVPAQEVVLPYVAEHVAIESVRRTANGWNWKFDPRVFAGDLFEKTIAEYKTLEGMIDEIPCRVGYLRCESGLVPPDMAERIRAILELRGPFVELAEAGHHPMLDQPLPLVAALRTLLEFWSIT